MEAELLQETSRVDKKSRQTDVVDRFSFMRSELILDNFHKKQSLEESIFKNLHVTNA